jgi:hypothetical protein
LVFTSSYRSESQLELAVQYSNDAHLGVGEMFLVHPEVPKAAVDLLQLLVRIDGYPHHFVPSDCGSASKSASVSAHAKHPHSLHEESPSYHACRQQ